MSYLYNILCYILFTAMFQYTWMHITIHSYHLQFTHNVQLYLKVFHYVCIFIACTNQLQIHVIQYMYITKVSTALYLGAR